MRKEVIEIYKKLGIDVKEAIEKLKNIPISVQCWQLDDIDGFLEKESLSGGIATTGNYPYKARNFEELTSDYAFALSLIPGTKNNFRLCFCIKFNSGHEKDKSSCDL